MDRIVLVGIDEAGYGPLLGPLVVSAVSVDAPAQHAGKDLWELLRRSVQRSVSARDARLPILDSKKLYHRRHGLGRLETSVLAWLCAASGRPPATLSALLAALGPQGATTLADHPWYRAADPVLPLAADAGSIRIAARRLADDFRRANVRPIGCHAEIVPESAYNRLVSSTRNKSVVLLGLTLRLLQRAAGDAGNRPMLVFVDKQGARNQYGPTLQMAFDGRRLRILEETDDRSAYELTGDGPSWRIHFAQNGETHHLLTAAASLVSKYVREALMTCFNQWWQQAAPGVRPTAGYYQDGLRFVGEIEPHLARLGISREQLVRRR